MKYKLKQISLYSILNKYLYILNDFGVGVFVE